MDEATFRTILKMALAFSLVTSSLGASYYLDSINDRDANDGLALVTAWQTIERANQQVYGPGEEISTRRS